MSKTFISIPKIGGGKILTPANTTADGMCAALTTRYEAIGPTNILSLAHFPMTVVLIEYK